MRSRPPAPAAARPYRGLVNEHPVVELPDLPQHVRDAVRLAQSGVEIGLTDCGEPVGSLHFRRHVIEGSIVAHGAGDPTPDDADGEAVHPHPEGVHVVAAAMALPDAVRARLSEEFGDDYVVLDIRRAPRTADIVLTHPVSSRLIEGLQGSFPRARIIVTELVDEEYDIRYTGDVTRVLEAGAETYLPPSDVATAARAIRAHVESPGRALGGGAQSLGPATTNSIDP